MIILSKFLEHEEESDINLFLLIVCIGLAKRVCSSFSVRQWKKPKELLANPAVVIDRKRASVSCLCLCFRKIETAFSPLTVGPSGHRCSQKQLKGMINTGFRG